MPGNLSVALVRKRSKVSLVPLIDVVFILLLFFLLSTQLNLLHNIDVNFPISVDTNDPPEVRTLSLLDNENTFTYLGSRYQATDLELVQSLLVNDSKIVYSVVCADEVEIQGLISFVDQLSAAGISNVSILEGK
ncbi:MAG: biopolymer transporter ExbD [Gammaproteobacteria bacterium]|nr:biopolymer transporter ExbD [Gammaproteobacteria bacterium]